MFKFFKGKEKGNVLYAPCKGKVVPLTEVPDPTFSEKLLGDGFAVIPTEGKVYDASSSSAANLWYSHGHRLLFMSGDDAGRRSRGYKKLDRILLGKGRISSY